MKLWLLLKKHNRLLTKLTSALCACLKKQAASNNPSGLLSSRSILGSAFYCLGFGPETRAIKSPPHRKAEAGLGSSRFTAADRPAYWTPLAHWRPVHQSPLADRLRPPPHRAPDPSSPAGYWPGLRA